MEKITVLVWFSCHRDYFRFAIPELLSLIHLQQCQGCFIEQVIPNDSQGGQTTDEAEAKKNHPNRSFVALENLCCLYHTPTSNNTLAKDNDVFLVLQLPQQFYRNVIQKILDRSIIIKGFIELWARGTSYEQVLTHLRTVRPPLKPYMGNKKTFSFLLESFGAHFPLANQVKRMNEFAFLLTPDMKVDLKHPEVQLCIFERWKKQNDKESEPQLEQVFFGPSISFRQCGRPWWWPYRLSIRPVLGPTTLDVQLAFLMVNQARIQPGMVVFDPFCGTGGLLLAASTLGGVAMGADIDSRVLKGWGISRLNPNVPHPSGNTSIFRNFKEYGLPKPEIVRADIAAWGRSPSANTAHHAQPWADVVLTDPPYGVRTSIREVVPRDSATRPSSELRSTEKSIPVTHTTSCSSVLSQLLHISSRILVDGGLLVFLLPVFLNKTSEALLEIEHKDFEVKATSLQELTGGLGRILVTLQRHKRTDR